MDYRNFGRTGVKVSALCLGTMNFGGRTEEAESIRIIDHALDSGINFVDTANVYGHNPAKFSEGRGRSEQIVGKSLQGKRDQVFLATKMFFPMQSGPNAMGSTRRSIIEACDASLKRLNTDWIDLYQMHSATSEVPTDEILRALDDLITAGKVRYIGTSGYPAWKLIESLWVSDHLKLNRFVSEQPPYSLLDRRVERELLPAAQSYGFAVIPWAPTAGGFLSGKYRRGEPLPDDSRFSAFWSGWGKDHMTDAVYTVVETVCEIAEEKQVTPYQLALAWCINQPGITSAIAGPRTLDQWKNTYEALSVELTEEDHQRLDAVAPPGRAMVGYYGDSHDAIWDGWQAHRYGWR